jgi:PAS domain S-box-containing protein
VRPPSFEPPTLESAPRGEARTAAGARARLWIVDDSPLEARRTHALLEATYAVEVFTDAAAALDRLAQGVPLPHLLVLDWHMPGLSGAEACYFLRERYDEVTLPILVLTASTRREDRQEALDAGANDFVPKPYDDVELRARVRTLVRVRVQTEALRAREAEGGRALAEAEAARALSESALRDFQGVTAALREREERVRGLLEATAEGIWGLDAEGRCTFANPTCLRLLGYSAEAELLGRDMHALTHHTRPDGTPYPREACGIFKAMGKDAHPGCEVTSEDEVVWRKDGHPLRVRYRASPIVRDGRVLGAVVAFEDVGARLAAQQEAQRVGETLRESEARLKLVFDTLPSPINFVDAEQRHLLANRTYSEWFGVDVGTLKGRSVREVIGEENYRQVAPYLARACAGETVEYEVPFVFAGGRHGIIHATHVPYRAPDGALRGYVSLMQDVTERKALETALRESEERLRLTLEGTGMGTFEADPATGRLTFDARMREVCNLGPSESISVEQAVAQVHPEEREHVAQAFARTMTEGVPYRVEHRVLPRPGQQGERWVAANGAAIRGPDGRVVRLVGTGLDITEQATARRHIEESEARFRLIANALPHIVWTATADFVVDWYNDWWFKYLGLPRGTRWDDPDTLPMHPEDVERTRVRLREAVETGADFYMEQRFRRGSDGQYRWHLVRGVPIRDADGRVLKWVGANADIHDQKTVTARLEEERELRERFVATLTHDLRTPLTAAKLNATMLARKGSDPTVLLRSSARIAENLDRADAMIRDMLDANRVRAGEGLLIEASECELTALTQETLEELALVHGNRFVLSAPGEVRGWWSCSGLRRVLENLCTNAIKYGAYDRPVTVRLVEDGPDQVSLSVHNWGAPIPREEQGLLFRDYRRAESAQAGPQKGWGLGLTVVEGLARAHRGTVHVESALETGTTFTVTLARDLRP